MAAASTAYHQIELRAALDISIKAMPDLRKGRLFDLLQRIG